MGVSKGILLVKCLCFMNDGSVVGWQARAYSLLIASAPTDLFCVGQISWKSFLCHKVEVNPATLSFGLITRFKTV